MRRSASIASSYSHEDSEMETEESHKRASTSNLDESRTKRLKGSPVKAGTAPRSNMSEKDQRKAARMIRNRRAYLRCHIFCPCAMLTMRYDAEAAQASRDRKKEHTQLLEQRISELEAQLDGDSSVVRAPSVDSTGSASAPLITALEEENQALRTSLALEQSETTRLRTRLENLETKFGRLESLLAVSSLPPLPTAPPILSPSLSLSALPLDDLPEETAFPSLFEPIFSFSPHDALQLSQGGSPASITLDEMELGMHDIDRTEEKEMNTLATPICSALVAREGLTLQRKQIKSTISSILSLPTPTPTLHQILSSIPLPTFSSSTPSSRISPPIIRSLARRRRVLPSNSTNSFSRTPGPNGRTSSPIPTSASSRSRRTSRLGCSTSSRSSKRFQLVIRR